MTTTKNKPIDTIRAGNVKATIWWKPKKVGDPKYDGFHRVDISRTWKDKDGKYHDSHTYTADELLRVAHVTHQAYERVRELMAALRDEAEAVSDDDTYGL